MRPTLHRLLWGPTFTQELIVDWHIRTWEIPALGLPVRVATSFFLDAVEASLGSREARPIGWGPESGPLTWELYSGLEVLSKGRHAQFGYPDRNTISDLSLPSDGQPPPSCGPSTAWEVLPHAAYFLPFQVADPSDIDHTGYALYCNVLLFLTALDGTETILHRLVETGGGIVPFEDRWSWRSRIHLPKEAWQLMERSYRWCESPWTDTRDVATDLVRSLMPYAPKKVTLREFDIERVDVRLEIVRDTEMVQIVRRHDAANDSLPAELRLDGDNLHTELLVRIGQLTQRPDVAEVVNAFPAVNPGSSDRMMQEIARVFLSPGRGDYRGRMIHEGDPDLILLPEISIPQAEVGTVRDLVRRTRRGCFGGLYWRQLKPVYGNPQVAGTLKKWFVNEAEIALPVHDGDRGPTGVRWYRVRKAVSAHVESALARELTESQGGEWRILDGRKWYRFIHPQWGDFTAAICSDLLDPAPWRSLRGEVLHLFLAAFNKDVDLYESLTWIRAYENYVNVVAANHGTYGGSCLWTPKRRHSREVARLRGQDLFLIADVQIPVQDLLQQQRTGESTAIEAARANWHKDATRAPVFKSPPPGFRRRALDET